MELVSLLPALTTTALFAGALWLGREMISTRLTRSVQQEFDKKIESVRADLRASEERFKAQLWEPITIGVGFELVRSYFHSCSRIYPLVKSPKTLVKMA